MQRSQLPFNRLWRCLCPRFDQKSLATAVQTTTFRSVPSRPAFLGQLEKCIQRRHYKTSGIAGLRPFSSIGIYDPSTGTPLSQSPGNISESKQDWMLRRPANEQPAPVPSKNEILLGHTLPTDQQLATLSSDDLSGALRALRSPEGYELNKGQEINRHERIVHLVRYLLASNPEQKPTPFHYECMMDAMLDTQGSADGVRALFAEMDTMKIAPNSTICQSALAALAIHPDYFLRQQVLDIMKQLWIPLDKAAEQHVLLAQLRESQYELAYNGLMKMFEERVQVDLWVHNIFVMVFGRLGYLDEMLHLLIRRKQAKGSDDVFLNLAYFGLDVCSSAFHYEGTVFTWNATVRNGLLRPSEGILENVLATAARQGDVELATEVHGMISAHGKVYGHHYEALAEAFANDGNISGAIRVLHIMERNDIECTRANTRSVYHILVQRPALLRDAEAALRSRQESDGVSQGVVASVIEAAAKIQGTEQIIHLYHEFCPRGQDEVPSLEVLQALIIRCTDLSILRELVSEYHEAARQDLDEPPRHSETNDKLIFKCLEVNDLDLAMRFAKIHIGNGAIVYGRDLNIPIPWLRGLVQRAVDAEDSNLWILLDHATASGDKQTADTIQKILNVKRLTSGPDGRR